MDKLLKKCFIIKYQAHSFNPVHMVQGSKYDLVGGKEPSLYVLIPVLNISKNSLLRFLFFD